MSVSYTGIPGNRLNSSISITDADHGKLLVYPREREIRSLIVRVQKSSLDRLVRDDDAALIRTLLQAANGGSSLSWPIHFRYRLLINEFMEGIVEHPFRELFAVRNISILIEYLLQQYFVMDQLGKEGNYLSMPRTCTIYRWWKNTCVRTTKRSFPALKNYPGSPR